MEFFYFFLFLSILSCSLVTGFIFTYAIIVMPGLSKLSDKEFLKAFQVTDAVIQNKQPIFMLIWVGSIVSVLSLILISIAFNFYSICRVIRDMVNRVSRFDLLIGSTRNNNINPFTFKQPNTKT